MKKTKVKNIELDTITLPPSAVEYWGPSAWKFIHTITFSYFPPSIRKNKRNYQNNYKQYFKSLGDILPCPVCRYHYQNHIYSDINKKTTTKDFNHAFTNQKKLIRYFYNLHTKVNKDRLGRDFIKYNSNLSYKEFKLRYANKIDNKNKNPSFMADPYWGNPPGLKS